MKERFPKRDPGIRFTKTAPIRSKKHATLRFLKTAPVFRVKVRPTEAEIPRPHVTPDAPRPIEFKPERFTKLSPTRAIKTAPVFRFVKEGVVRFRKEVVLRFAIRPGQGPMFPEPVFENPFTLLDGSGFNLIDGSAIKLIEDG